MKWYLWVVLILVLPNSGVLLNTDNISVIEPVTRYGHASLEITHSNGKVTYIDYNVGEAWACGEDYAYIKQRTRGIK